VALVICVVSFDLFFRKFFGLLLCFVLLGHFFQPFNWSTCCFLVVKFGFPALSDYFPAIWLIGMARPPAFCCTSCLSAWMHLAPSSSDCLVDWRPASLAF
jgi:hypothetical protein